MQTHTIFYILAAVVLVGAIAMALSPAVTWASSPFFVFALALVFRGVSLQKNHHGAKNVSYGLFGLGLDPELRLTVLHAALENDLPALRGDLDVLSVTAERPVALQ